MQGFRAIAWTTCVTLFGCADPVGDGGPIDDPDGKGDSNVWYSRGHFTGEGLAHLPATGERRGPCFALRAQDDPVTFTVLPQVDGDHDIYVSAYQEAAGDEPARMRWTVDGAEVAVFDVNSVGGDWDVFHARTHMTTGARTVAVSLANDLFDAGTGADRNLVVCRYGVDRYGDLTLAHVPEGAVRLTWDVVVPTSYSTRTPNSQHIATRDTKARCVLKGQNPGRTMLDCHLELDLPSRVASQMLDEVVSDPFVEHERHDDWQRRDEAPFTSSYVETSRWFSGGIGGDLVNGNTLELHVDATSSDYSASGRGTGKLP